MAPKDWVSYNNTTLQNAVLLDANSPTGIFASSNGWHADTTNYPTYFTNGYGAVITVPYWRGTSLDDSMQLFFDENGNASCRKREGSTWKGWKSIGGGGGLTTFREKGVRNADYGNIQGITITVSASAQHQFIDGFIFSRQGLNSFRINTNASGVPDLELTHINGNDTFQWSVNGQTVNLQATTTWNDFGILYFGSIVESNLTFGAITA